jgi:hypothetical protein
MIGSKRRHSLLLCAILRGFWAGEPDQSDSGSDLKNRV